MFIAGCYFQLMLIVVSVSCIKAAQIGDRKPSLAVNVPLPFSIGRDGQCRKRGNGTDVGRMETVRFGFEIL